MTQQINLYNPAFLKRNPAGAPGALLAYGVVGVLALALGVAAMVRGQVTQLNARVAAIEAQIKTEQEKSAALGAQRAARVRDPALEVQVASLEGMVRVRNESMAAINGGALGNTSGFSGHMRALARQPVSGLWLTGFSLTDGGAEVALRGRMLDAALLPRFLERLRGEKVFEGKGFKTLVIGPPVAVEGAMNPAPAPFLAFEIATREAAERAPAARQTPAGGRQ